MPSETLYLDAEHIGMLSIMADERGVDTTSKVAKPIFDDVMAARDGNLQSPALSLSLEAINHGGANPAEAASMLRMAADELEVNGPSAVSDNE